MDLDTLHLRVTGLLEFKKRIEAMLEGVDAGSSSTAEISGRLDQLSEQATSIASVLDDVKTEIAALRTFRVDASAKLDGVNDMLAWFGTNKDALDTLLSIGDDFEKAPPTTQPEDTTEQPAAQAVAEAAPASQAQPAPEPAAAVATEPAGA